MFYTFVTTKGNKIIHIGYDDDGKKFIEEVDYKPRIGYCVDGSDSGWKTLDGKELKIKEFSTIKEYKDYIDEYSKTIEIYNDIAPPYQFIADRYEGEVPYKIDLIRVLKFDIEVASEDGFPSPEFAEKEITSIAIKDSITNDYFVFSLKPFDRMKCDIENPRKIHFKQCRDDKQILRCFIKLMWALEPDILVGWYSNQFDVPYLINRAKRILDDNEYKELSPINRVACTKKEDSYGRDVFYPFIGGITLLDYQEMYKKYTFTPRESYTLDYIAEVELGENKINYDEFDDLNELWEKNPQKYIFYNLIDTELIDRLDQKLNLINLHCTIAYDAKANLSDPMGTVKLWDVYIFNYLRDQKIMIPPFHLKDAERLPGAFVKKPETKIFNWVISGDLNSLYPHLMQQFNISPETLIKGNNFSERVIQYNEDGKQVVSDKFLNQEIKPNSDYIMAANGYYFDKEREGFTSKLMKQIYAERKIEKKKMLEYEQELENLDKNSPDYEDERRRLEAKVAEKMANQQSKKILMNSLYGAFGNRYFRFFDIRLASAITLSSQMAIKWIEKYLMEHPLQKKFGWEVIYVDTDSNYLCMENVVNMMLKKRPDMTKNQIVTALDRFFEKYIQPIIDEGYKKLSEYVNANENRMFMKREIIAEKGMWLGKKKYALTIWDDEGVRLKDAKLKVKGIEIIKSSTPKVVQNDLKKSVEIILTGDEKKIKDYIREMKEKFKTYEIEEIAFPRGVNNLAKYSDKKTIFRKGTPIHVRASLLYNKYLKDNGLEGKYTAIQEGTKIKFLYMKKPNPIHENVFGFLKRFPEKDKLGKYVDYDMQFEKAFMSVINNISEKIGINFDEKDVDIDDLF
jgi:DNA polymerase elongation subunit (family B)